MTDNIAIDPDDIVFELMEAHRLGGFGVNDGSLFADAAAEVVSLRAALTAAEAEYEQVGWYCEGMHEHPSLCPDEPPQVRNVRGVTTGKRECGSSVPVFVRRSGVTGEPTANDLRLDQLRQQSRCPVCHGNGTAFDMLTGLPTRCRCVTGEPTERAGELS